MIFSLLLGPAMLFCELVSVEQGFCEQGALKLEKEVDN